MSEFRWYTIIIIAIALGASSAIGALIYAALLKYRNRVQPIGRRVDISPTFEDPIGASCLRTQLVFSDGKKNYKYEDLHIVQIQLSHQGDLDFEEFKFGITLSPGDVAVYIEAQSPDRNHQVEQLTPLKLAEPKSEIDFVLRPLNRTDTYSLRLLIITNEVGKDPGEITFSSPQAVNFVALPTVLEVVENAARSAAISVGPFSISLGG